MSELVQITSGALRWHVDPALLRGDAHGSASGLFHADGPRIEEWLRAGQATVIKNGARQSVYHVVLPGLDFHLKHYRLANTRAWLRSLLRPAKACLEFERTRLAAERGLPTLTTLAAGESTVGGNGSSYLVTRTLPDAVPLQHYLEATLPTLAEPRRTRLRQRIAVALGQLLAHMHHAGVTYRDLHPGNLLLQLDAEERVNLFLIDVYAVTFGPPLTAVQCRDNLIILNRWFMLRCGRSDRLRCWQAYQAARRRLLTTARSPDVRELEHGTLTSNLHFWRHLDRRCLGTNRHFKHVRRGEIVGHVVADLDADLLACLLDDPDQFFGRAGVIKLKESRSSTVIELAAADTPLGKPLNFTRFAVTKWTDPWTSLVRRTPALRSFVQGHGLNLRFLPTPRPLAVLHRQQYGLQHEGYLLTEKVEDAVDVLAFVNRLGCEPLSERAGHLRRLIDRVAHLVCTMHQRRLSHRDLKAANLLVRTEASPASFSVWFIDLVGVVQHRRLRRSRRVQNLARLHTSFHNHPGITRTDKLRFLRSYLRWGLRSKLGWKTWWRRIDEATRDKIARNLRNRRPLG